ncbi:bifunctional NADH dehydrogenase FAD-containing subunit/selenide,water dikinase SelD [Planctomycetia bacterium]|nr:bifunctional NADH dehydrogenase FAD-containing subunit/selenide,water dikinase SelD [Planctomycetia bacterium]
MNSTVPIEKHVVLVGAGNAHLVFLKRWRMSPWPGVAVTLVSESAEIPYSAMVPGHVAGDYRWDEITLDLVRFCRSANARFVAAQVTGVDAASSRIEFADRPAMAYDVLSLGLGSLPAAPPGWAGGEWSFSIRPLGRLARQLELLEASLAESPRPFHLAVVGGGASGCELALAIQRRLSKSADFRLTLLQANRQLLPSFPNRAARLMSDRLRAAGIDVRLEACVISGAPGRLRLSSGEELACDGVLWATPAAPPELLRTSGLSVDESSFLQVGETLQSRSHPTVFGTGDCVTFLPQPTLPRNGVHAVRQGRVLFDNVREFLHERPLAPFRPQRNCLCLMNTSDGEAILNYGSFATKGRLVRGLKERIDRAWLDSFGLTPARSASEGSGADNHSLARRAGMADAAAHLMRCGGCGAKVSGEVLSSVLCDLNIPDDPRVLLGTLAGEDAAVHRVRADLFGIAADKLVEVQTVDYFRAFLDDPYLFGRIAALHSVSDLYAMNARPFSALAIATLPHARGPIQAAQLRELLAGATRTLNELGVVLTGGHTSEGHDLSLGFAVTGYADEDQLFRKGNLAPGDVLILTKPLGTGAVMAAWMRGECSAAHFDEAVEQMLIANKSAAEVFAKFGARACTDITGFGLAGHLLEMLDASHVSARLNAAAVPILSGFDSAAARGIFSTLQPDNARSVDRIRNTDSPPTWLFDPQTSGGLLAAVPVSLAANVLDELHRLGLGRATVIGEVLGTTTTPVIELLA